ncbi:hypothetical protein Tco_0756007 [Tanacetum coccineum]
MASNKSFVSSPMVDDCVSVLEECYDVSVNSKPSVTQLYAVNDEAFMVDKKYVNVTDLNLVSYEKVSISDRDDLEKKIDEVQVLDNVVCVDRNKNVYGSEAKTSAAVAFVVIKELYFNFIFDCWILNDDAFIVDKKYVNITDLNFSSDEKVSMSDRDDLEKKIHDVQVLDNVVCVDRTKDVYGSEAKTSAADYVVIKKFGSENVDVNTNDVVADEDVDLAVKNISIPMASNKSFVSSPMVDDCDSYTSDETVQSKVTATEVLAVKDDAFMVDKKYVNASALNLPSDENVIISDRDVLEKEIADHIKQSTRIKSLNIWKWDAIVDVDDVPDVENVVSDGNKCLVMLESGKIAFNGSHAKSVDVVAGNKVDDVLDRENVVSDGNKCLVMFESGKIAFNGSHAKSVDVVAGNKLLVVSKDVNGSESKANDVDSVVKDKIFGSGEVVDSNVKKIDIKDDDGNVVVSNEKLFNGDEDVDISQQNYVVSDDKMLVSAEAVDSEPKNMLFEAKRSDTGDVDMVPVSDENMSVSDDGVKADFVVVPNLKLMAKEIQLSENEMIEVVSVKETIIISYDDEVPVVGSSEKKAVSDYTFSSDDDDRSKNHHRSPIALQFVLDEASEDEEELWGIIFNDLAVKLNNFGRHPSPVYARFISLILEKALGNNYVIYEEIALRIPLMGNSIFNLEPTSSEVLITCHMDRVCKSVSEACLVSEDVAGLNLYDNVYDGSSSEDPKFNEIIQNVKTKTMSSLLDPNSIATTDVYQYKVVTNVLNEDVIGESAIPSGSCDHNLKDDCYGKANEISDCLNEEVIDQSAIYSGSGDQNIKDDCPGKTIKISNCLSEEVVYQSAIPSGYDDHNLKVDCYVNSNEVSNIQNHVESDNQLQSESNVYAFMLSKQVSPSQSIENLIYGGGDIINVDCDDESENEGNHRALKMLFKLIRIFMNLTGVTTSLSSVSVEINGLTSVQKDLKDEINELKKSSSSNSSIDQVMREVISAIQPELKSIKEHISASNSSLSKVVTKLSAKQKELVDELNKLANSSLSNPSMDDISKAVVGLIKPELESFVKYVVFENKSQYQFNTITQRPVQLSPECATLPEEIQRFRSSVNDIVTFKAVNDFENRLVESVPSKKERLADQQLMEVISINQALIKANISKISDSMLVLVKWAKSIFVDGSASASKTTPGCEKSSFKLPVFNRDVTELSLVAESNVRPLSNNQETTSSVLSKKRYSHQNVGPDLSITNFESYENVTVSPTPSVVSEKYVVQGDPQGQTSSHVEVEAVHSSSVETNGHQNVYPESSNKNVESCENVTVSSTPSDKQVGTFEYEVGGVKYLMTPEEIAKQKDDEEIIKRKNQEEKASYAKIVNVLAEDERNLHIRRVSAIRDEEDHNLEVKYKNRKILYDKYVRALNPQCRNHPEKITAVDIISRKGPVCVTIYRASLMVIKAHAPLKLSDFNYFEWLEIQKCVSTKKSKQAQVILENIEVRINELRRIEQTLGIIPGVPLSELDPMIEFHDLMNKRKLDEREMEGSFVAGMECDLSLPFELENKKHVDGQVVYEPEYGMLFRNSYMHRCFIRVKDLCKCSLERLYLIKGMYYHTHTDSSATSIEKEFIRFVETVIDNKNDEYPPHKRIKIERDFS